MKKHTKRGSQRCFTCAISKQEAKKGCVKYIRIKSRKTYSVLVIPPRTQEGEVFTVSVPNTVISDRSLLDVYYVKIHIFNEIRLAIVGLVLVTLVLFARKKLTEQKNNAIGNFGNDVVTAIPMNKEEIEVYTEKSEGFLLEGR